jgi:hypothetical protein
MARGTGGETVTGTVLPTFLVIGAMKAGTTSLHEYLRTHPSIFMPELKEPEFFSEPDRWARGVDWYSSLFEPGADRPIRGEASTGYTRFPRFAETPERIARVLPDARLVYLLRDPVDRMRSHYHHSVLLGREHRPVDEALLGGDGYLETSRYATQLRRYLDHFPAEQVMVAFSEDMRTDRRATLERICRFVGADPTRLPTAPAVEHHVSRDRLLVPGRVRRFAELGPVRRLRRASPGLARQVGRRLARGRHVDDTPSPQTRRHLLEMLADDLDELRTLTGPLPDTWFVPS